MQPFHLAFLVQDLDQAKDFYINVLGCEVGRCADTWVDFSLFGHQLSAHLKRSEDHTDQALPPSLSQDCPSLEGKHVPVPHFGVIVTQTQFAELEHRLERHEVELVVGSHLRLKGQPGEQRSLFFCDPSGNALEFKTFSDQSTVFAK